LISTLLDRVLVVLVQVSVLIVLVAEGRVR
jgi:hypothetical protein